MPSVSLLLRQVFDGVGDGALESQIHWTGSLRVEAGEEFAGQKLHGDVMRPLVDLPLVAVACVPDRGGDVAEPVEPTHLLHDLAVGGIGCSGDELRPFLLKELVVLLRVDAVVGFKQPQPGEQPRFYDPIEEGFRTLCMRAESVSGSAKDGIRLASGVARRDIGNRLGIG
jgi:hypothetical protein